MDPPAGLAQGCPVTYRTFDRIRMRRFRERSLLIPTRQAAMPGERVVVTAASS